MVVCSLLPVLSASVGVVLRDAVMAGLLSLLKVVTPAEEGHSRPGVALVMQLIFILTNQQSNAEYLCIS